MIDWIQTGIILLLLLTDWYRRRNFEMFDDRLRELELRLFERRIEGD